MSDAFATADFYSCELEHPAEFLSATSPDEAIDAWLDLERDAMEPIEATIARLSPITVRAYVRGKLEDLTVKIWAERAAESAVEQFDEEYGDPDGGTEVRPEDHDAAVEMFDAAIRRLFANTQVWHCEEAGTYVYCAAEVETLMRAYNPRLFTPEVRR